MESFAVGPLNKVRRPDRANYDKAAVHAVLDEGLVAHVGFIDHDRPVVVPMVYGRDGDRFYLHGAKAARFAKAMGAGVPICATVTLADGIVVGRSAFHCSMNYRSVVLHGEARLVTDAAEAERALAAVTDHLLPGRWAESRPMIEKELRATAVLRVEIEAASLKARSGAPIDEPDDYALPIWAGVIPLRIATSAPEGDVRLLDGVEIPASVNARASRT
jgi:nitroimidazol reductase NimA-like FMN-containing flavoprotein (pyridoxamine 5'-phosphate oxidase superfamily)